jgi:hypothetical protein
MQALNTFKDRNGVERKSGEEWLVTSDMCSSYIPDPNEVLKQKVQITVLSEK